MTALWVTHRPDEVSLVEGKASVLSGGRIAVNRSRLFENQIGHFERGCFPSAPRSTQEHATDLPDQGALFVERS